MLHIDKLQLCCLNRSTTGIVGFLENAESLADLRSCDMFTVTGPSGQVMVEFALWAMEPLWERGGGGEFTICSEHLPASRLLQPQCV